jgi:hypothetical protein
MRAAQQLQWQRWLVEGLGHLLRQPLQQQQQQQPRGVVGRQQQQQQQQAQRLLVGSC